MTRKETIIVAVLINAGLLVILFATALGPNNATPVVQESQATFAAVEPVLSPIPTSAPSDEVDQMLKQYSSVISSSVSNEPPAAIQQPVESAPRVEAVTVAVAEPAPVKAKSSSSNFVEVKVKKGDVLEKIARIHHCNVEEIMRLNDLTSTRLQIGQTLRLPSKEKHTERAAPEKTTVAHTESQSSSEAKFYIVKNGDNPWTIAVKNHMKVEELLRLNHLDEEKARRLKPGDQLRIK